jgi:hypothetical protein
VQKRQPRGHNGRRSLDARNHYPQIKHHTPPPKQGDNNHTRPTPGATPEEAITASGSPEHRAKKRRGLVVSKPNSVFSEFPPARTPKEATPKEPACLLCTRTTPTTDAAHPTNRSAHRTPTLLWAGHESRGAP